MKRRSEMTPEALAACRAKDREKARLARQKLKLSDPEKLRAKDSEKNRRKRVRVAADPARRAAYNARHRKNQASYLARHPDRSAASKAKYEAKIRATRRVRNPKRPTAYSAEIARESRTRILLGDEAYRLADAALSRRMDPDVRDDVLQSIVLACLEGSLEIRNVKDHAAAFVTAYWRGRPEFRLRSLDAPSFDDGRATLHDVVSTGLWEASL